MKHKIVALFLMAALLALPGCGNTPPTRQAPLQKVTVLLDWFPNTNHTGLYVAQQQGYYQAEGLDVEIIQPPEGGQVQLLAAGQGDFAISAQEEIIMARSQGIPVVAVAAVIQHNTSGFAAPQDRGVKAPADFEGKTYGGWGSPAEEAVLKSLMNKYQADFSKLKVLNIGSADFFTSVQKDIDFAWIFWGWTGIEAELKNMPLSFISLREVEPRLDYYTPVLVSRENLLNSNPDLAKRFMKATSRGYQYAIQDPDKAAEILLGKIPELNRDLVINSQRYLAAQYQADASRWGEMQAGVWQGYADFMFENGLLSSQIDTATAFSNDFLPAAQ
ncbi:MAG TPA: ABC transporter substrate-binding protein [Syntrophomonas sp.]|jgi:ABC-type nitrate/sulfonate/bicarbonate transport system substrate-binding protein|nr:ABC transporter substrate-binding protein [Syntrophomonas sp.]